MLQFLQSSASKLCFRTDREQVHLAVASVARLCELKSLQNVDSESRPSNECLLHLLSGDKNSNHRSVDKSSSTHLPCGV